MQPRNMTDYEATYASFRWDRPEFFNFATDVIDRWAAERPDATALLWSDENGESHAYSFQDLRQRSLQAAQAFAELGLRKGDRVFVVLPRVPEWWFVALGCIRAGLVLMPGTSMLTNHDIRYRIEVSHAKAVVADADGIARFHEVDPGGSVEHWISVGHAPAPWRDFYALTGRASGAGRFERTRADDPMLVYFTSGTTGMPKMVEHSQASYGIGHQITGRFWLDLGPDDRHMTLSDTGWAKAAWGKLFGPWSQGACNVVYDFRGRFEAKKLLDVLQRQRVTTFCAPPTAYRALVLEDLRAWDLASLRHAVSAGEPLNPEVIEAWHRATGLEIREGYGQTECVVIVGSFPCLPQKRGSMGRPSPGFDVRVIDEAGNEVPPGKEGDIAVRVKPERPAGLFQAYANDPRATAEAFRGDFYVTGDRAVRDEDGYLWFVGRKDDVIKTSGYRVGPFEVESALLEHPAVAESAVVGVPDERIGQRVKAYVILKPGYEPSERLAVELQTHVKQVTAPYKYPREIEFVAELPKTISGKIRRNELRAREG